MTKQGSYFQYTRLNAYPRVIEHDTVSKIKAESKPKFWGFKAVLNAKFPIMMLCHVI